MFEYKVALTWSELIQAGQVGVQRQCENLKNGAEQAHGATSLNSWQRHIDGALGECALAKFLGVYWAGKGKMRDPDVGSVDVRCTRYADGHLTLHKGDPDDRRFYLLTGIEGKYIVRGWILARDGKREEYWSDLAHDKRYAFNVPQSALHAIEDTWMIKQTD